MLHRILFTLSLPCAVSLALVACSSDSKPAAPAASKPEARKPEASQPPASKPANSNIEFKNMKKIGNLYLGGQPSPDELRSAVAAGVTTVVNLRGVNEPGVANEQALAAELNVKYVSIPITGADDLTPEAAKQLDDALASAADNPVIVHCASGNRVGGLFAVRAHEIQQKPAEEAMEIGKTHGMTQLAPALRKRFGLDD